MYFSATLYPDGNFIIRVVDSQNVPLINTRIVANLNYPEYQESYRGTVTNSEGEGKLDVPQDSESEFISGEYEFKVIQYLPDGSFRGEIIKETLTADNTYPVFNLSPVSWTADIELYKDYEDTVVIELVKDGKPVKNTWTVLKPAGVAAPDSGGAVPKLGKSEGYTDAVGCCGPDAAYAVLQYMGKLRNKAAGYQDEIKYISSLTGVATNLTKMKDGMQSYLKNNSISGTVSSMNYNFLKVKEYIKANKPITLGTNGGGGLSTGGHIQTIYGYYHEIISSRNQVYILKIHSWGKSSYSISYEINPNTNYPPSYLKDHIYIS